MPERIQNAGFNISKLSLILLIKDAPISSKGSVIFLFKRWGCHSPK